MANQENQLNWEDWNNTSEDKNIEWGNNQDSQQNNDQEWGWEDTSTKISENLEESLENNNITPPTVEEGDNTSENTNFNWVENEDNDWYSVIGKTAELYYDGFLYNLKCDNFKIIDEINNLNLTPKEKDGRYEFSPQEGTELGKLIKSIVKLSLNEFNLRIIDCNIIKTSPNESFLNIFNGKPAYQFLYIAQSNDNSGDVVIDFSSIGGPSYNIEKQEEGTLILIPGWIPFRISKNNSEQDHILINGMIS